MKPSMPIFFIVFVMSVSLILLGSGNAEEPIQVTEEEYMLRRIGSVNKEGRHTSLVLNKEIEQPCVDSTDSRTCGYFGGSIEMTHRRNAQFFKCIHEGTGKTP